MDTVVFSLRRAVLPLFVPCRVYFYVLIATTRGHAASIAAGSRTGANLRKAAYTQHNGCASTYV